MNKAFAEESDNDDQQDGDALALAHAILAGAKNHITRVGYQRIKDELLHPIDAICSPRPASVTGW